MENSKITMLLEKNSFVNNLEIKNSIIETIIEKNSFITKLISKESIIDKDKLGVSQL